MKPVTYSDAIAARFMTKVSMDEDTGCWNWTGFRDSKGYGRFQYRATDARVAHQVSYGLFVGHMDDGLQLDHLCRNTSCVNPEHLEPVTAQENMRRRAGLKTHCPQGHEYTPENSYYDPKGTRYCRTCKSASRKAHKEVLKAQRAARGLRHGGAGPKTHCVHGHEFDEANTYLYRGVQNCRACRARRQRERNAELRQESLLMP